MSKEFYGNVISKCHIIMSKRTPVPPYRLLSSPSTKLNLKTIIAKRKILKSIPIQPVGWTGKKKMPKMYYGHEVLIVILKK